MNKEELINIYNQTEYVVPDLGITILPNSYNHPLDKILQGKCVSSWAFISASNPFSQKASVEENQQYFERLEEQVKASFKHFYFGFGKAQNEWEDEKSFLILGIGETKATQLGKSFNQNAILIGPAGNKARIKWLAD